MGLKHPSACWLLTILVILPLGSSNTPQKLYRDLMQNYTKQVLPRSDPRQPLVVELQLELTQIIQLEEKKQILTTAGFFVATWRDEFLTWDPARYGGIADIIVPPTSVWLPDFGIENSADTFYHDSFMNDFRVYIVSNGTVQWAFGGDFRTLCTLDMTTFPFDVQSCAINIENWTYTGFQVALVNGSDHVETRELRQNGIWHLAHTSVEHINHFYATTDNVPFPEVKFRMLLARKSLFYTLNLVLPCFFMILVALGVFWVPPSSGEKISLGITVLLAFSVFQLVLQDIIPPNSDYSPLIGRLLLVDMAMSSVSLLTAIFVVYLQFRDCHHRVPYWLRVVALKGLARILCVRNTVNTSHGNVPNKTSDTKHSEDPEVSDSSRQLKDMADLSAFERWPSVTQMAADLRYLRSRLKARDEEETIKAEWAALARVVDRLMFWLCLGVMVGMGGYFVQHRSHARDIIQASM